MDDIQKPIFEMKMTGEVTPASVPASLLGEFIVQIEKSILAVLGEDVETGSDIALVSLVGITEGSNRLSLASPATVIPAVGIIADAIIRQDYERIPRKAHQHLYDAVRLCQRQGWGFEIVENQRYSIAGVEIPPGEGVPKPQAPKKARGNTTIIGSVIKAGGVEPRIHIKVAGTDDSLHIGVSPELAVELAGKLYQKVALECQVSWNMDDWSYDKDSIKVVKMLPYSRKGKPSTAFAELRASAGGALDLVSPTQFRKELYDEEASEPSVVKR